MLSAYGVLICDIKEAIIYFDSYFGEEKFWQKKDTQQRKQWK